MPKKVTKKGGMPKRTAKDVEMMEDSPTQTNPVQHKKQRRTPAVDNVALHKKLETEKRNSGNEKSKETGNSSMRSSRAAIALQRLKRRHQSSALKEDIHDLMKQLQKLMK
jgi:hypothetical protein